MSPSLLLGTVWLALIVASLVFGVIALMKHQSTFAEVATRHARPADGYAYRHRDGPSYLFYESW